MQIGRRIYYELITGNIIVDTGERSGSVIETTEQEDYLNFVSLTERVPATVGMIQFAYGQYAQDFQGCNGYTVDVSGTEPILVFSYPDPAEPEAPPIYRKPLSEQIAEQELRLNDIDMALAELFSV
jgi:hypothetical protein